jgi:hypothetical protein
MHHLIGVTSLEGLSTKLPYRLDIETAIDLELVTGDRDALMLRDVYPQYTRNPGF